MSDQPLQISQKEATELFWRSGILKYKLHSVQREAYEMFYTTKARRIVWNLSRRSGKSFLLCVLALEQCLRVPNSEVMYFAPTKKQVKRIIPKLFRVILEDCPEDLKPSWFAQEQLWEFKNGSTISLGAMDAGRADSTRGTDCSLGIVDEAGFSPSNYVSDTVEGVLRPMTLLTRGKILLASTPSKSPRHAFELYYKQADLAGAALHKTIYDNPLLSQEDIKEEIEASGGEGTTHWRREYLAEFIVDEEIIAFPEFDKERQNLTVLEVPKPSYYDCYTSMDVGMKDATGILFSYWDFKLARFVVEDEALLHGVKEVRTDLIAELIKNKERALWGDKKPYFRISDTEPILLNDLDNLHGIKFVPADKDSKEAAVNELRMMIKNNLVIIHPRCKNLIAQLESCIWNSRRDSFDRVEGYYHFDLVDALIYGVRGVRKQHNPYPAERYTSNQFYFEQPTQKTPTAKTIETLFKPNRKFGV